MKRVQAFMGRSRVRLGNPAQIRGDGRAPELVEHGVETMLMQRIVGIALDYEDLVDHDQLRHDPVLAALVVKLMLGDMRKWTHGDRRNWTL